MREVRYTTLLLSALLLYALTVGCTTPLADPASPNSSLVIGRVVIKNQWHGELDLLPLGTVKKGIGVEIKSKDGSESFTTTAESGGYFFVSNIPHNSYYISKVVIYGQHLSVIRQEEEEYHIALPKGPFFTPVAGKSLDIGGYALEITEDGRLTRPDYLSANPEAARSHLREGYPGSPWLKRVFISGPVSTTGG